MTDQERTNDGAELPEDDIDVIIDLLETAEAIVTGETEAGE